MAVHIGAAVPWRQLLNAYGPDDNAPIADLTWDIPADYAAGDLLVVTTDSPVPAIYTVEVFISDVDDAWSVDTDEYSGVFDGGLSIAAVEAHLGDVLPAAPATLGQEFGERVLRAIEEEATSRTPWRSLDERGCREAEQVRQTSDEWTPFYCACCGRDFDDVGPAQAHTLIEHDEIEFFGARHIVVCGECHDILHEPVGPSAEELLFRHRPLCPRCSAERTFDVLHGMPAGPPGPATLLAGCVIVFPIVDEFHCSACEYEWSEDDDVYAPIVGEVSLNTLVRARIAPIPEGVVRPHVRTGEPGRLVLGTYRPRELPPDAGWGGGVAHEVVTADDRRVLIDPDSLRLTVPATEF